MAAPPWELLTVAVAGAKVRHARKTVTFDGSAGNGAVGTVSVFTVSGEVLVLLVIPFISADLTDVGGTALLSLGVTGSANLFGGNITAINLDTGEYWNTYLTAASTAFSLTGGSTDMAITDNIIATVGIEAVTGGTIRFDVYYLPLSPDARVDPV